MGGLMIAVPVLVITAALNIANLLGATVIGKSLLVPMTVLAAFAALGAIDDLMGIRGKNGEGMLARVKFPIQVTVAMAVALILYFGPSQLRSVALPGVTEKIDIGLLWIPIAVIIIVGEANAVNFTDGLDGLAGIIAATAFMAYAVIAYLQSFKGEPPYTVSYLVPFSFTVAGACLAFLWFNAHPAQMFMGDTGSEALGATLGVVALMTGQWLLLPVVGLIPVAEALSVVLQVAYFKYTKRRTGRGLRLFKMSPLHNHFELLGWSETQVVQRFWLVGL